MSPRVSAFGFIFPPLFLLRMDVRRFLPEAPASVRLPASFGLYLAVGRAVDADLARIDRRLATLGPAAGFLDHDRHDLGTRLVAIEIGRASCRERVCQYV